MKMRMFVDTSVIGGCFDDEFDVISRLLFAEFITGKAVAVISSMTLAELQLAPDKVRRLLDELPENAVEYVDLDEEATLLADKYIADGVVGKGSLIDAQQVAVASLSFVDVIVIWNFKHIVNLKRIRLFASVNLKHGLITPEIRSPREVLTGNEQDI